MQLEPKFSYVAITYAHTHECSLKGETIEVRPDCSQGVAFVKRPVCIELMVELELVSYYRD